MIKNDLKLRKKPNVGVLIKISVNWENFARGTYEKALAAPVTKNCEKGGKFGNLRENLVESCEKSE